MIDSHCHLDFEQFDDDRTQVITRCLAKGISGMIIPGVSFSQWQTLITLCRTTPCLYFALGIHPYFIDSAVPEHIDELDRLLHEYQDSVKAVGEIGLDFHLPGHTKQHKQIDYFENQLALATKHQLPVILHHRESHNQIIQTLKQQKFTLGGAIHAFSGSLQQAKSYIDLGFKLGIGGTITYPRASKTRNVVANIPIEHILLETDSPDMPINGKQGQRNSPEYLPHIVQQIAELTGKSFDDVVQQTSINTVDLFKLNSH